mgnify:CR=1 FL=1
MKTCAWCPAPSAGGAYGSDACPAHTRESIRLADALARLRRLRPGCTSDEHGVVVYNLSVEAADRDDGARVAEDGWMPLAEAGAV